MTTFFVTNRQVHYLDESLNANERPRNVDFDLNNNIPSASVHFCVRKERNSYVELGNRPFLERLREHDARQILLYVHGYSNLPEPHIFPRTHILQTKLNEISPGLALVVPLIWPCDNDLGVIKDYWDDQKAADASAYGFARMLMKFLEWRDSQATRGQPCYKRINILAHSMGNRTLRAALSWCAKDVTVQGLFRNVFMVAADVVNHTLESDQLGRNIPQSSRNVTVYHANDDLALLTSKVVNVKNRIISRRLGHTGPEDMARVPKNVYVVDCDDFNNKLDTPKGHSYFLAGDGEHSDKFPVLRHIAKSMEGGRVDADSVTRTKVLEIDYRP